MNEYILEEYPLEKFFVVRSRSNKHPEFGYPHGAILCRCKEHAEKYIENSEFNDLYMEPYKQAVDE